MMDLSQITASEIVVTALILIGTVFLFVGSLGLATLPDLMRRLHAPTKATTLGIGAMLVASMLWFDLRHDALSFHELLIALFLFMTAPVSAHMIAKAHMLRDKATQAALPPAPGSGWATLTPPSADPRET
ncbi:Na+/H+ antiporter subunit G [Rhodoplanes elegans]|nr:Na+/H+ antiporter subunit G [Rhodoplanes elegans]